MIPVVATKWERTTKGTRRITKNTRKLGKTLFLCFFGSVLCLLCTGPRFAVQMRYLLGSAIDFRYAAASVAEGIISIRSVPGGISRSGSLSRAVQGFVYVLGSSRVTDNSSVV